MASGMDRTRFEGYKVMGTLGSGTFGVVYKVQPDSQQQGSPLKDNTEQVFALKRVQLGFGNTERERELVRREEQILKAMKHRHVIRYVHSFFEDNVMCIVMEYCDGGTLHQYIRALKQKMHEDTFICFLEQIAQGLKYLHGKKILHRDIKTKNILMTSGNILKIGDFGISKFVDNTKPAPHSILMGTPRYMSPQVAKRDDYDQKTDIWGLGCTAYEMAVFTYAFPSADLKSVLDNVKGGKIPDLTEIRYCSEIKGLISQMLQYNPEDRPSARKVLKILLDHECSQELAEPRQLKEKDGNGRISPQPTEFKTDSGLGSDTATLLNKTDPQTRAKKHLEVACCDITTTIVDKIRKRNAVDIIKKIKDGSSLQEAEVVGSQARILYSDQQGRISIATAFNDAVAEGRLKGPVVLSRDHHDVSGTDSPFRETSNIYDGSAFCADMAVQNAIGDAFRGATWVALHNGGGVGWGEVINGGFGLVLDGSKDATERAKRMLAWDVSNGVARRCWSGNSNAEETVCRTMDANPKLKVTLPHHVQDTDVLDRALNS